MKRFGVVCLILFLGCTPEKAGETLATDLESPDSLALEEVVDSVSNTRIDGTATTTFPLDIKQQLPAELEVHLDRTHSLWQLPALAEADVARVPAEEQGPYFVQADFNGDKRLDYAIQLLERDSVFVYVFLNDQENGFQEHLLGRLPTYGNEGKKKSNRYLRLTPKNTAVPDKASKKNRLLSQEGLAVATENATATYFWDSGKFIKVEGK